VFRRRDGGAATDGAPVVDMHMRLGLGVHLDTNTGRKTSRRVDPQSCGPACDDSGEDGAAPAARGAPPRQGGARGNRRGGELAPVGHGGESRGSRWRVYRGQRRGSRADKWHGSLPHIGVYSEDKASCQDGADA
jgi:hypothetical protein